MREIRADKSLIAFCGLYCGACQRYMSGKCPGCRENTKASWCGVRTCCQEHHYASCADCNDFPDPRECGKYNNFMARIFGFIFRSDRAACIDAIRKNGYDVFARDMAGRHLRTMRR